MRRALIKAGIRGFTASCLYLVVRSIGGVYAVHAGWRAALLDFWLNWLVFFLEMWIDQIWPGNSKRKAERRNTFAAPDSIAGRAAQNGESDEGYSGTLKRCLLRAVIGGVLLTVFCRWSGYIRFHFSPGIQIPLNFLIYTLALFGVLLFSEWLFTIMEKRGVL